MHPEPVPNPEIETEAVFGNVVSAIASALCPGAMIGVPPLRTALLPGTMPLPGALLLPSPLLLPRDRLLPRTLRLLLLLGLLGTLCLLPLRLLALSLLGALLLGLLDLLGPLLRLLALGLLGALLLRLLVLRLLALGLLGPLLLRLLALGLLGPLLLRLLVLCGWRCGFPLLALLLLRLALLSILLVVLRICRGNDPNKQKQAGTRSSNESHTKVSFRVAIGHARRQPVRSTDIDAAITGSSARQVHNLPAGMHI